MTIQETLDVLGLTIRAEFVPYSKSCEAKGNPTVFDMSLNWLVTLQKHGRDILTTDYTAAIGHCPSYPKRHSFQGFTVFEARDVAFECEHGRESRPKGEEIIPNREDVLYALVSDADVLNFPTYEEWAEESGFDPDSRRGEQVYCTVLGNSLRLLRGMGVEGFAALQEAFQNY